MLFNPTPYFLHTLPACSSTITDDLQSPSLQSAYGVQIVSFCIMRERRVKERKNLFVNIF